MIKNFEDLKLVIEDRLCYEQERLNYDEEKVFFELHDFIISIDENNIPTFNNKASKYASKKSYEIFSKLHEKYELNIKWHHVIDYYLHESNDHVIAFAIYENKIEFIFSSGLYMIYKSDKTLIIKSKEFNQKFFDKINKKFLIY